MKNPALILILLISFSCSADNFDWLCGTWVRTNDDEGCHTYEYWIKESNTEYTGMGCTLQNTDTIFKEEMKLISRDGNWDLEVSGVNESPTVFHLINRTNSSFTCENKLNDFPKIIEYSRQDSLLLATISANETEILFSFERE